MYLRGSKLIDMSKYRLNKFPTTLELVIEGKHQTNLGIGFPNLKGKRWWIFELLPYLRFGIDGDDDDPKCTIFCYVGWVFFEISFLQWRNENKLLHE